MCIRDRPNLAAFPHRTAAAMRSSHSDPAPASCTTAVARPRLLDEMRARMRRLGLSLRTEEAYVGWVRRFILASGKRHPREMGAREVEAFLTAWATRDREAKRVRFIWRTSLMPRWHLRSLNVLVDPSARDAARSAKTRKPSTSSTAFRSARTT